MSERRREILETALKLADEGGLESVSMRAVAARVGVSAMALYQHVRDKEALLDGVVGLLLAELPMPDPSLPWERRMRSLAWAVRDLARAHPSAIGMLFTRPAVSPDALRVVDGMYGMLLEAGVPEPEVPRLERLLSTAIVGFAVSEVGGRFSAGAVPPKARRAQVSEGVLPWHERLAPYLDAPVRWEEEFARDLDDLRELIQRAAAGARPK